MGAAPVELAEDAACFHHVPPGPVNEVAARLFDDVGDRDLVALGGGRVIDVAKAIAAVKGSRVAALPTTLSGAEMTRIHRLPDRQAAAEGLVRPAVVLADPPLMVGLPEKRLRASAMNALAHGADSLYTPLANPVSELAALRGAKLIAKALDATAEGPRPGRAGARLDPLRLRDRLGAVQPPPRRLPEPRAGAPDPARRDQRDDAPARARDAALALRAADDGARAGAGREAGGPRRARHRARRRPAPPARPRRPISLGSRTR